MPIIGMTDQETIAKRTLPVPVLASLKKGAEKPANGVGRNLSYFRFDWEDKRAETLFNSMYGEGQQNELLITVLADDVDAVLDSSYRLYKGNNTLERKCDGCTILGAMDKRQIGQACICDPEKRDSDDPKERAPFCQPKAYFRFTIPDLCKALGYLGQFVLLTGSVYEMRDMATVLYTVKNSTGKLLGQPFLLRRSEKHYDVILKGQPKRLTQFNVEIIPPLQLVLSNMDTPILGSPEMAALPSGNEGEETLVCANCGNMATVAQAETLLYECPDCGYDFVSRATARELAAEGADDGIMAGDESGVPPTIPPARDINNVDDMLGTTPPVLSPEQRFMLDLIEIVKPMCNHENHARNAIQKAIDDNAISAGDKLDKAAYIIFERRCKSRWGLNPSDIPEWVDKALGMGLKAYFKDNPRDYAGVWGAMVEACKDLEDIPF